MRNFLILLIVFSFFFSSSPIAHAATFVQPIKRWKDKYFTNEHKDKISKGLYHIGVDVMNDAGTKVRNIGEGIVKHVDEHAGFGTVVLIEHILKSGKKVVSLYGHLRAKDIRIKEGQKVGRAKEIGKLGKKSENGGYSPHLHFAVRKGTFVDTDQAWVYQGRATTKDEFQYWYEPTSFIKKKEYLSSGNKKRIFVVPDIGGSCHVKSVKLNGEDGYFNKIAFEGYLRGGGDIARGNVDKKSDEEIIVGSGPGRVAEVQIYKKNMKRIASFQPFGPNYTKGVRVATGDVDGDTIDEVLVASRGGGHLRVYDKDRWKGIDYFPFGGEHRGGLDIASGNFDKDDKDEIVVSNLSGGQARIKIYDYSKNRTIKSDFVAFGEKFQGGARIQTGDLDKDGKDEIVVGMSTRGGKVSVFEKDGKERGISLYPYGLDFTGGVSVSTVDFDDDKKDEIVTIPADNHESILKIYKYNNAKEVILEKNVNEIYSGGMNVD